MDDSQIVDMATQLKKVKGLFDEYIVIFSYSDARLSVLNGEQIKKMTFEEFKSTL